MWAGIGPQQFGALTTETLDAYISMTNSTERRLSHRKLFSLYTSGESGFRSSFTRQLAAVPKKTVQPLSTSTAIWDWTVMLPTTRWRREFIKSGKCSELDKSRSFAIAPISWLSTDCIAAMKKDVF